jgi:hypothetical protein
MILNRMPRNKLMYDPFTKILLHLNGNFTDSSANAMSITNNGSTFSSSPAKFTQSAYCNGSLSYFSIPANSLLRPSSVTGWTLDFWYYPVTSGERGVMINGTDWSNSYATWAIYKTSTETLRFVIFTGGNFYTASAVTLNEWNHIEAKTTTDGYMLMAINGVWDSNSASTGSIRDADYATTVGYTVTEPNGEAYFDEIRISNTVRHSGTTSFTPPTSEYLI